MTEEQLLCPNQADSFSEMDRHFASFLCRLARTTDEQLWLAAALTSQAVSSGHVCLDLTEAAAARAESDPTVWAERLRSWPVVGTPGDFAPLILDGKNRLYLHRYWSYEQQLAELLLRLAQGQPQYDRELLKEGMGRLFPTGNAGETDWQQIAALACVNRRLAVIAGGPGTGKTSTVFRVLILLIEQAASGRCHIALAAPTGKAAVRLNESITIARTNAPCSDQVLEQIPEQVSTLHRLLGFVPGSSHFRYNRQNRLPYDVVVVDEASMISLPLMAKLIEALRDEARLILLGDRDQLASVEAGAVLGDICNTGRMPRPSRFLLQLTEETTGTGCAEAGEDTVAGPLADSIVILRRSYRFDDKSGIGEASRLVNEGSGTAALELLLSHARPDASFQELSGAHALEEALTPSVIDGFGRYLQASNADDAFALFNRFRILCPLRHGPFGTETINRTVARILAASGLIRPQGRWYPGQPVMIARNDYALKLFNGDVGIILPDPAAGNELRAFFPTVSGQLRSILPLRLPEHETAFAMTVHKSQGSEFDKILLLLPDKYSDVITRELIYTALTRAKEAVEVLGSQEVFIRGTACRTLRRSGLADALWGEP